MIEASIKLLSCHTVQIHQQLQLMAETQTLLLGGLHVDRVRRLAPDTPLRAAEFRAFSQHGEDGILQFLLHHIPIGNDSFIEFGVQNYLESNTRFLLKHDNWRGLVIDSGQANIDFITTHPMSWQHDLTACRAFITRDNINRLFVENGFHGDIGLLSIDIDGNDYWVWEAVEAVSPRLVVCEYNSLFGADQPVSVPYREDFDHTTAHYSHLYFGASLPALCVLAGRKGYDFVGCDSSGANAFFVRRDLVHPFRPLTAREGYVESRFRTSRGPDGRLSRVGGAARRALIRDMPVVDVVTGETVTVGDLP